MKKNILLTISTLVLLFVSCKKSDTTIPTSGTVTLSSQSFADNSSYAINGFSFSAGAIHKYPGSQTDLLLLALQTSGDVDGAIFSAPDYNTGTFNNTAFNQDLGTAETLYNNYSEVTATNFKALSDSIMEGQIITYKTGDNKFAKFLVLAFRKVSQGNEQYAEVDIKWQFQPNGTAKF